MRRFALLLAATVCLPVQGRDADFTEANFTGCWFGIGTQGMPETATQSINHRSEDGTFSVRFVQIQQDGQLAYSEERGYWAVNGSRYLTISTTVNGTPAVYAEVYDILHADAQELSYRSIGSGNLFQSARVPCDTRLPRPLKND